MFQGIDIKLLGPICKCRKQNLSWATRQEEDGRPTFLIFCKICKIAFTIPSNLVVANILVATEYPEGLGEDVTVDSEENQEQRKDQEFLGSIGISSDSNPK
ncbi:MAG: hypothetical protein AAB652_00450 [Patescibacteria group bacterium]